MFRTGRLALAPCLLAGWWLHLHLGPHLILLTLWVMVPDTRGVRPSVHPFDQAPIEGVFDLVGIQPTRRALDPELVSPFRWQQHGKQEGAVTEWSSMIDPFPHSRGRLRAPLPPLHEQAGRSFHGGNVHG